MNTYKLTGKYRQQTAIGIMEHFRVEINAVNPKQAMDNQREIFYNSGYDHVLFESCSKRMPSWRQFGGYDFVEIPMLKALSLE